ncbi:MAG TPA: DUF2807 domain-containing protein [Chitinophagales bacterium]|nr:DUF2807 domain-containing protein [Chitinophagales bacterium]
MKLIIALIVFSALGMSLLMLSACRGKDKKEKRHEGGDKVATQIRSVRSFSKIYVEGIFPVELSQDGSGMESVKVEAEEDVQQHIHVTNDGDKLSITMDDNALTDKSKKIKVFINLKKIDELEFKSVGSLTTWGPLKLDSLQVNSESVGKLNLEIEADFLRTNFNSVGATTLKGKVREARINNKSVGTLSAYGLKAGTLMIHNTAIGTAEVYADSAFYIRSESVGTLYYKGPGLVKEMDVAGVGQVKKVE